MAKRSAVKWLVLQMNRSNGECALPNFKFYHRAFMLRGFSHWLVESKKILKENYWRRVTGNRTYRMKDFLFLGISTKTCNLNYGPLLTYMLMIFQAVKKYLKCTQRWYKLSPFWNNRLFLSGGKPLSHRDRNSKGIKVLRDIKDGSQYRVSKNLFLNIILFYSFTG